MLDKYLTEDTKTFERLKDAFARNFDVPVKISALSPVIDVARNKSWNETPIEGSWDRTNYPAYLIRNDKSSKIATAIGNFFKNEDGLSPKQVDYLIKGYFASVGDFLEDPR